jgi:hypothetical protein
VTVSDSGFFASFAVVDSLFEPLSLVVSTTVGGSQNKDTFGNVY